MAVTHGRTLEWGFEWRLVPTHTVSASGHDTKEDALRECVLGAIDSGWTPPGWWQFWRWSEPYWSWSDVDRQTAYVMWLKKTHEEINSNG